MRRFLVPLALACAALPVLATSTEEVTVKCPVCDNEFKAERCNSSNNMGGQDRDFCEHAAGGEAWIISCWTCPRCCYTGFPKDFDPEKAPKVMVEGLKKENPLKPAEPIDPKLGYSRKIPPWVRYDLLIQRVKLDAGTTSERFANLCLRTAQTQRFDWDALEAGDFGDRMNARFKEKLQAMPEETREKYHHDRYDIDMTIARALEAEAADAKAGLDAAGRIDARVGAAVLYKMRGEDADAERVLAALAGVELNPELKAVVEDIRVRIERERKYRQLAIPYFEKHIVEGKPDAHQAVSVQYLLGVLYRRTGDPKKAVASLEPLLTKEGIPEDFLTWIKDELAKAKAG
ncbi:MAG: DUF2225 domain-containing protein [Planctomycetota bacterium]